MPEDIYAAIYARVSGVDQKDFGTSLTSQMDRCRRYAESHGYTVVLETSDDHTGFDTSRPGLDQIKELARNGKIDKVICYDQDRLVRGDDAFYAVLAHLSERVRIEFVTTGVLDTQSFAGKLVAVVNAMASGEEARKIKERTMRGRQTAHDEGRLPVYSKAPYGYRTVSRMGTRKQDIEINDSVISDIPGLMTEPEVVAWIFAQYATGAGASSIAVALNDYGIRAPDRRRWNDSKVRDILGQEQYTGRFFRNKVVMVPHPEGKRNAKGKIVKLKSERPRNEWLIIEREDLAIIPVDLFDRARETMLHSRGATAKNFYLMARRIVCVHGNVMRSQSVTRGDKTYSYYNIKSDTFRRAPCECRPIHSHKVDKIVWDWFVGLANNPEAVLEAYREMQVEILDVHDDTLRRVEEFDAAIKAAERELEYLVEEAREHRDIQRLREMYREQIKAQTRKIELLKQEARVSKKLSNIRSVRSDARGHSAVPWRRCFYTMPSEQEEGDPRVRGRLTRSRKESGLSVHYSYRHRVRESFSNRRI